MPTQTPSTHPKMLSADDQGSYGCEAQLQRTQLPPFLCDNSQIQSPESWRLPRTEDSWRCMARESWVCAISSKRSVLQSLTSNRKVQVTLQILAALIEKAPRDLPLYAPHLLNIFSQILRSRDITMVESSIPTFAAFCEYHDGASLVADQEYSRQYADIVRMYASFASTKEPHTKSPMSAPLAMRWRDVGLQAVKSVASSEALSSIAGRQLDVIVPVLLENTWADDDEFLDLLESRMRLEEKVNAERMIRRRTSAATVQTVDTADKKAAASCTADADKLAVEDTGVLAMRCLKDIFVVDNRSQIYNAIRSILAFIEERVSQGERVLELTTGQDCRGWAIRLFQIIARWTHVQDRFVILVVTMDTLVRSPMLEANLSKQLVLSTIVDSLLNSDINLIGLSVMDVLLGLIQHVLRVLQLGGAVPHLQQTDSISDQKLRPEDSLDVKYPPEKANEISTVPSGLRRTLLTRLQLCIGHLATHVYYADQISDMVSAILLRLKPTPKAGTLSTVDAIDSSIAMTESLSPGELSEDPTIDGFFSFDTAKVKALEAIKAVLVVASRQRTVHGGTGRNNVPMRVWEGTQWLLRDADGRVRKAYVDTLLTWLEQETTKADLRLYDEKSSGLKRSSRDDSGVNLPKRAASSAPAKEKSVKQAKSTFLPMLHLAIYENAHQFVENENNIVLLHLLLAKLIQELGVNAARSGIPMIYRLQEDILEAETPRSKIRFGSLCHGYFWALSEWFDFESSPIGRIIQMEILRRRKKGFWVNRICMPPIVLAQIEALGQVDPLPELPLEVLETESLRPFDERFEMVKLISLSYAESLASPPASPAASPGRVFSQPILKDDVLKYETDRTMPENVKDQMMSEWSKEYVMAKVQETSKTVSLNGSRSGTTNNPHRNFLVVNGIGTGGGNSGTNSPNILNAVLNHHHRSRPTSNYGLVGGLGPLGKLRQGSAQSPSPASESSRNSVTCVDQLKRVLSGQHNHLPASNNMVHSDASSESMVSYNPTASEISISPHQEPAQQQQTQPNGQSTNRTASTRQSNDYPRPRSKSRDRTTIEEEPEPLALRPLSSNPTRSEPTSPTSFDPDAVPPVPPLPAVLALEGTAVQDNASTTTSSPRKPRSSKRGKREFRTPFLEGEGQGESGSGSGSMGSDGLGPVVDLQSLLRGIESGIGSGRGSDEVVGLGGGLRPPY